MGFESHVDSVIEREVPELRNLYYWCSGMVFGRDAIDLGEIEEIVKVLNESGEFGPARYNEDEHMVEFGCHFDHTTFSPEEYQEYWDRYIDGEDVDPW